MLKIIRVIYFMFLAFVYLNFISILLFIFLLFAIINRMHLWIYSYFILYLQLSLLFFVEVNCLFGLINLHYDTNYFYYYLESVINNCYLLNHYINLILYFHAHNHLLEVPHPLISQMDYNHLLHTTNHITFSFPNTNVFSLYSLQFILLKPCCILIFAIPFILKCFLDQFLKYNRPLINHKQMH